MDFYKVKLGYCGATDCTLRIYYGENYKEFEIESLEWNIISLYWNIVKGKMKNNGYSNKNQKLLKTIYNN